ncbi:MAG: aromatic ring-hydroxylating dioxygenase subunit alpha [Pseudomonadota bacterium]
MRQPMLLRDIWYFAGPGEALKNGDFVGRVLLGKPLLIGRDHQGEVFAFRDICPHRGVPLSSGSPKTLDGRTTVECPYHGWQFGTDGRCALIPSLVMSQNLDPSRIRTRAYHVREVQGNIWVWIPAKEDLPVHVETPAPAVEPPVMPGVGEATPKYRETMIFSCDIDHAVIGLMDPAHGPFVHQSWWWRTQSSMHEKKKFFGPTIRGFSMRSHKPSSNSFVYKLLGGDVKTEIEFNLPGLRTEHITAGRHTILGLTTVTPLEETGKTEVTQTFYWDLPLLSVLKPFLRPFVTTFLRQDRDMVDLQQEGLRFNPRLMLINDADVQAKWYFQLKKEWDAHLAEARPFLNPVPETTLEWRS